MNQVTTDRLLKPEVLGRIPLLSNLASEELNELAGHMRVRRFGKGDHVVLKGSASDALMFLLAGSLQAVDYTEDGKEIGLNLFFPGNFFGELALIDGKPRSASIVAIEPSVVAFLPQQRALALIYGKPEIAEKMLKHFAAAIRSQTHYRALLAIPNAPRRLYALLCHLRAQRRGGGDVIANIPTQQQIAIMINTSRETVSRTLAELMQMGVLRKKQRTLQIVDAQLLERLAMGSGVPEKHPPKETAS